MKLQNIFALIVTLIGFAACTSESELSDTPINDELVPVTISLGSLQAKASVGLENGEGTIQNAVIGIFDSKGIPTVAPIELSGGSTSGQVRLPLALSSAYAFVNVSAEDIAALKAAGSEAAFKNYAIKKQLTQDATALPKFGKNTQFTPTANGMFEIPVNQLAARLDVRVSVELTANGQSIDASFVKESLVWSNIIAGSSSTSGNDGNFTTTINNVTYGNVINRTYSYPGATPTIALAGKINGVEKSFSYTFDKPLVKDNVYLLNVEIKGDVSKTITIEYQMVSMESVNVDVPEFS